MEWILYVVIGLIAVGVLYWLFVRKPQEPALPPAEEPKKIGPKPEPVREKPAAKPAPEKKQEPPVAKQPEKVEAAREEKPAEEKKPAAAEAPKEAEPAAKKEAAKEEAAKPAAEPVVEEPQAPKAQAVAPTAVRARERDVAGLRKGLGKSRSKEGFFGRLAKLISGHKEIDPAIVDELEEVLISSDVGVTTTERVLARIREGLNSKELDNSDKVWEALRHEARRILSVGEGGLTLKSKPYVVLFVGVNGSGKTTTIGKLATHLKAANKTVVLAAGDTFRAAAVQQLEVWGKRVGCEVVKGKDGADPGAVIFDAIELAIKTGADVVLADTAGRLHTKTPLMDELKKVVRTMGKALQGAPHEVLLVLDSTNGQNALAQSRQFAEALTLTGIVLTKLDGTAKGGVILGVCDELKVPVRYIGIGERPDDLREFDAGEFVEALLGGKSADEEAA